MPFSADSMMARIAIQVLRESSSIGEPLALAKDKVAHQNIGDHDLLLVGKGDKVVVGEIQVYHALGAHDGETEVVDIAVAVGGDPAVFHMGDPAVFKFDSGQIDVGGIDALRLQDALAFYRVDPLDFVVEEPAQGVQGMAAQEPEDHLMSLWRI